MKGMTQSERDMVYDWVKSIPPFYLHEALRAFRLLDRSLTQTVGRGGQRDWLDHSHPDNLAHDLVSVMAGNMVPDERGLLRPRTKYPQNRRTE